MEGRRRAKGILALAAIWLTSAGAAAPQWVTHEDQRGGFRLHVPPGLQAAGPTGEPDIVRYEGENSMLSVERLDLQNPFAAEARSRRDAAAAAGWFHSYEIIDGRSATFHRSKDGRVHYAHGVPLCDGAAVFFQYDYHYHDVKILAPILRHMALSLQSTGACAGTVADIGYPTD
nr:long-chain-fatty-acid--CoA ligase FadD [Rhizobium sp. Q54]